MIAEAGYALSFLLLSSTLTSHCIPNYGAQHLVIQKVFNLYPLACQNHDLLS